MIITILLVTVAAFLFVQFHHLQTERMQPTVGSQLVAVSKGAPSTASPFEIVARARSATPHPMAPVSSVSLASITDQIAVLSAACLLVAFVLLKGERTPEKLPSRRDPTKEAAADSESAVSAEEQKFADFAASFRDGPTRTNSWSEPEPMQEADPEPGASDIFFRQVPKELIAMRALFLKASAANLSTGRQPMLADLSKRLESFKESARMPSLLPIWQLAAALEGLLGELAEQPCSVTPSSLRSTANALDLLNTLCVPDLNPGLITAPPIRILVVDDDAVIRQTISLTLKKALRAPDLANDGKSGLEKATQNAYDLIFLDVEMPGIDGFELCSKIRETNLNRDTPVIFVTGHSDFNSRAKSILSGGQDLIAKPLLAFEITVKGLTLVMSNRLHGRLPEPLSRRAQSAFVRVS